MKTAIFWDGPAEGKAMVIDDRYTPTLLVPLMDAKPQALFDAGVPMRMESFRVARYECRARDAARVLGVSGLVPYVFVGMDR